MSNYGLRVYNTAGNLVITEDVQNFMVMGSGVVGPGAVWMENPNWQGHYDWYSSNTVYDMTAPDPNRPGWVLPAPMTMYPYVINYGDMGTPPMLFINVAPNWWFMAESVTRTQATFWCNAYGNIEFKLLCPRMTGAPAGNYGLVVYRGDGMIVFDSNLTQAAVTSGGWGSCYYNFLTDGQYFRDSTHAWEPCPGRFVFVPNHYYSGSIAYGQGGYEGKYRLLMSRVGGETMRYKMWRWTSNWDSNRVTNVFDVGANLPILFCK